MLHLEPPTIVLAVAVGAYTLLAAAWDIRFRRIPNWLNVSALALGLIYQYAFYGMAGLSEAGSGFAIGFGTLFVLWLIGGGGAGDVKLLGALGVWLGFSSTFRVIVISAVLVGVLQLVRNVTGLIRRAFTVSKPMPPDVTDHDDQPTRIERTVAFAVPVAVATWLVGVLFVLQSIAAAA